MRTGRVLAVLVAAAIGAAGFATQAQAVTKMVPTDAEIFDFRYDIGLDKVTFFGIVDSSRACTGKRKVVLRQVTDGIRAGDGKTKKSGRWNVSFKGEDVPGGRFRLQVKKKVVRRNGDRIVCRSGRSAPFNVLPG